MASSDPNKPIPCPWPDSAAMPPYSWAKRTGFSGETIASDSGQITTLPPPQLPVQPPASPKLSNAILDLEAGSPRPGPANEREQERVRKWRDSDGGTEWRQWKWAHTQDEGRVTAGTHRSGQMMQMMLSGQREMKISGGKRVLYTCLEKPGPDPAPKGTGIGLARRRR